MIFAFAAKLFMMSAEAGMQLVSKVSQFACGGWASWG